MNIRVTPREKEVIRRAAESMNITVTELMVQSTLDKIVDDESGFKGTLRRMREEGSI